MILKIVDLNNCSVRFLILLVAFFFTSTGFSSSSIAANNQINPETNKIKDINLNNAIASNIGVTSATLNLVKQYEGFRTYAYIDTSGYPVIGYGQSKIRGKRVRMGQRISRAEADAELARELYHIQRLVQSKVKVKLNPNQLGALTSLVYNAGTRVITSSTLARKLNAGNYAGCADEFLRWNKANQGGRLVPLAGLTKRRKAERQLFLTPYE